MFYSECVFYFSESGCSLPGWICVFKILYYIMCRLTTFMSICLSTALHVLHTGGLTLYTERVCETVWVVYCVLSCHIGPLVFSVGPPLPAAVISAVWETQYNTHSYSTLPLSLSSFLIHLSFSLSFLHPLSLSACSCCVCCLIIS